MLTPSAKYFCPSCSASFEHQTPFCGQCGTDMRRASLIDNPARTNGNSLHPSLADTMHSFHNAERRGEDPWLGKLVDGRYQVEEILGRGGMGIVYKVKHLRMGKIAAMKVLHSELAQKPEVVGRFRREAEAVSRLTHPNTVQIFDFGTMDGALYLVMEYVRGQDLGALVDRDGPMDFMSLAPLLGQICGSLEEAHALGIVHRDLKPENILVSRTHSGKDFIKVLDFGLAKLSERDEASSLTSAGSIVGTPYYMSPEQIRADESVDKRSDIYSFGALLYQLISADNAFNAKTPVGVLTKHLTEELEPAGTRYPHLKIPPELDIIIGRCMEKEPADRYDTVRDLLEAIEALFTQLSSKISNSKKPPASWITDKDGSAAFTAIEMAKDIDYGIDANMRLRREDLDDFERRIKRKRSLRIVLLPILLLGVAALLSYFLLFRPELPHKKEVEPNNKLSLATLITANTEITGTIGKRVDKKTPDIDFYRFEALNTSEKKQVISVRVSSPENIDISIGLYNSNGKHIKHANQWGIGQEEFLRRWRLQDAAIISIQGIYDSSLGPLPVENVSDTYTLHVRFEPVDNHLESEPNDTRSDASPLIPGTPVTGYLDHAGDIDVYRVDTAGSYKVLISGGPDTPFQWRVNQEERWRSKLQATVKMQSGDVIHIQRRTTQRGEALSLPDASYTIDLSPNTP